MEKYDRYILKLDADSIALLYAPNGKLGAIAEGRDSIRNFLHTFKNIRVLQQHSITESINIQSDTAVQIGSYNQTALINNKDTVHVKGTYNCRWIWISRDGWHIQQMETSPTK